jgi:outer membrane protein TolC
MKSQQLIDSNMKDLGEREREINNLVNAGMATKNDLLRIQLQRSNTELSKKEVDNARQVALYNLKLIIGLPETADITIDTTHLINTNAVTDFTQYENSALQNRTELQTNQLKLKAAETSIDIIKGSRYPNLAVGLGYNYINPGTALIPDKNTFVNAWNVGLNLSWNISSLYADKGKIAEANANISQLKDANDLQTNAIKTETFQNFQAWELATEKISVTDQAIAQAQENYHEQESRYRNNVSTLSDMLDANTLLLQAQFNKVNALVDAQLTYYKLLHSTGKFDTK